MWLPACTPVYQGHFIKESTLKGKNLLALGIKYFPFRVDPFLEGRKNNFDRVVFPKSESASLKRTEYTSRGITVILISFHWGKRG